MTVPPLYFGDNLAVMREHISTHRPCPPTAWRRYGARARRRNASGCGGALPRRLIMNYLFEQN